MWSVRLTIVAVSHSKSASAVCRANVSGLLVAWSTASSVTGSVFTAAFGSEASAWLGSTAADGCER